MFSLDTGSFRLDDDSSRGVQRITRTFCRSFSRSDCVLQHRNPRKKSYFFVSQYTSYTSMVLVVKKRC